MQLPTPFGASATTDAVGRIGNDSSAATDAVERICPRRGQVAMPSRDIIVRRCSVLAGHAISIGSEMSGGIYNVRFSDITFNGALITVKPQP